MTAFIKTSREELPIGDKEARGRSALRLGDIQASRSSPRFAIHDGGDVRSLAIWDIYFIDEACRRLPRTAGIIHFHTGWAGMSTLRLGRLAEQRQFHCRKSIGDDTPQAVKSASDDVQESIIAYATKLDRRLTIVLSRVLNEVPDPTGLIQALVASRGDGGGVIATAMGSPTEPFAFNVDIRLGLPDWAMVRSWVHRGPPFLSAIETTTVSVSWPQHILFGVAYAP